MWRKVACWSISETLKDRLEEKLLWKAYRNSFERYHPKPIRPPLPQHWWFATPPKTPIVIISGTNYSYTKRTELQLQLQLRTSNFVSTFIGSIGTIKSPLKISKIFRARIAHSSTFLCIDKFTHVMFRFRRHISVSNNK